MLLKNCSLDVVYKELENKKIIFFGCGSWLNSINYTELMELKNQFAYVIDNGENSETSIGKMKLPVYKPEKVKEEENCVIILSSPVYMYDMYLQLEEMKLSDNITCYSFPFMQMVTENKIDNQILSQIINNDKEENIPKIIHCFWFSGDEKPEAYQKCIDTWADVLKDYEIKEWNMENYDWHKHPFVERAIEMGAWAFASDYARLDVLYEYGGIYLDMDVEVFKPFDDFLGNEAILSFSNHIQIDLAVIGGAKGNDLIKKMLDIYDDLEIPLEKSGFSKYFQPALVRETLAENGIKMNGSLQLVDNRVAVFPKDFFMPLNIILFNEYEKKDYTYCVHYDNFGWSFSKDNKREKKKKDNNLFWDILKEKNI